MTRFAFSSQTALAAVAGFARTAATVVATQIGRVWVAYRNRRAVNELMGWDDVMLKDIGLTRGDVYRALACPSTEDPSARLVVYGIGHRGGTPAEVEDRHRRVTETVQAMLTSFDPAAAGGASPCRT